jgi:hypothetical protein
MSVNLTGRDPVSLLEYEAARRPEIAALLADAPNMSDADLARAQVPLPWYRNALRIVRDRAKVAALKLSLEDDPRVIDGVIPDGEGVIADYVGETFWMKGRALIEIRTDTMVFLPLSGGVWVDWSFYPAVDPALTRALRKVATGTRQRYHDLRNERLSRLHGDAPVINLTPTPSADAPRSENSARLAAMGVRIGR